MRFIKDDRYLNANHRLFTFILFTFRRRTSKKTIDFSAVV